MTLTSTIHKHPADTVFCLQGAPSDFLYVLRNGSIGVYINDSKHQVKEKEVLANGTRIATINQPGTIIGEGGLFVPNRTASLVALTEGTEIENIPLAADGLRAVLNKQPGFGIKLCRCLASRLATLLEKVRDLVNAANAVEQAYDNLALAYVKIVEELRECGMVQAALLPVVESVSESILFFHAQALSQYHHETVNLFQSAASNKRSGTITLTKDQVLCEEGALGRSLYLVRSGNLSVEVGSTIVGSIGPGEVVGEIAVLLKELPKRTATVRASCETTVNVISTSRFYELAESKPESLIPIARRLAARLDRTNQLLLSRHQASNYNIKALAGDPLSCAEQFRALAKKLVPFEEVAYLSEQLLTQADQAEELCEKLLKQ